MVDYKFDGAKVYRNGVHICSLVGDKFVQTEEKYKRYITVATKKFGVKEPIDLSKKAKQKKKDDKTREVKISRDLLQRMTYVMGVSVPTPSKENGWRKSNYRNAILLSLGKLKRSSVVKFTEQEIEDIKLLTK